MRLEKRAGATQAIDTETMIKRSRMLVIFPKSICDNQNPKVAVIPLMASTAPITPTAMKTAKPAAPIPPTFCDSFVTIKPERKPINGRKE